MTVLERAARTEKNASTLRSIEEYKNAMARIGEQLLASRSIKSVEVDPRTEISYNSTSYGSDYNNDGLASMLMPN